MMMDKFKPGPATVLSRYKFPSAAEFAIVIVFLVTWLLPVISAWAVSVSGREFSFVALHWQNQNVGIVGVCILVALATGVVAAIVVLGGLNGMPKQQRPSMFTQSLNGAQRLVLIAISLISAIGLFKSFGGTIFEKGYAGPSVVWLGYGAWSVTFLLSLSLLVSDFLSTRPFRPVMVFALIFVLPVVFVPFLLSGSRIDFLSFMLALAAYILVLYNAKFKVRIVAALAVIAWALLVAILVGNVRYGTSALTMESVLTVPVKLKAEMIYLSTVGDIGASVFQIVGLMQQQAQWIVGIGAAVLSYATRLLPGPFYPNRPGDYWTQLPESIGGGALHALGEGYLISGIGGCALVGAIFGMLIALSIFAGNRFRLDRTPLSWVIFAFPWLLLIRGGWYQFFSLFKSIEILLLLLFLLMAMGWVGAKYSTARGKEHVCR